ncbi:MAG: polysaccharide deacetylase [Bacteroidetes bacterium]|nr:MAG: polysaccharide deacetylase [Bacteroidota bacterium]
MNWEVQPPLLIRRLHTNRLWRMPADEKKIYLTFDDGPCPGITDVALDILKDADVKAAFFCVGENAEKHPALFERILNEGHAIGNHSYNHLNGWKTDTRSYIGNVEKCDAIFSSSLFRPPYGKMKPSQSKRLRASGYCIVMWDVLSGDYDTNLSGEACLQNVLEHTRNGSIIVMHDSEKAKERMLFVLPRMIEELGKRGFVFEKLK